MPILPIGCSVACAFVCRGTINHQQTQIHPGALSMSSWSLSTNNMEMNTVHAAACLSKLMRTPGRYSSLDKDPDTDAFTDTTTPKTSQDNSNIQNRNPLQRSKTNVTSDFLLNFLMTTPHSHDDSCSVATHGKDQSFKFTYEMTIEDGRKMFPPSPNTVIMDWRKALPPNISNLQTRQQVDTCSNINLFVDTSSPCDASSQYTQPTDTLSSCPSIETRNQGSSSNRPDKCENSRICSTPPLRDYVSTSSTVQSDSRTEPSSTLTGPAEKDRRRRRLQKPTHANLKSLLDETTTSVVRDQNLASFQHILSLKPSLQFSTHVLTQDLDSTHQVIDTTSKNPTFQPLFPIHPTSTALMILFPTIQSFSKVNRILFGETRDRASRTRMQQETGCRFYRLFKSTILDDCSCILCLCHDTEHGAHTAAELSIGLVASGSPDDILSQLYKTGIEIRLCNTTQFVSCVSQPYTDKRTLEEDLLLGTMSRSQWGRALYTFALLHDSSTCPRENNSMEKCRIVFQRNPFDMSSQVWMTVFEFPSSSSIPYLFQDGMVIAEMEQVTLRHEFQFYLIWDEEGVRSPYVLVTGKRKETVQRGLIEALRILLVANERERSLEESRTRCSTTSLESWGTNVSQECFEEEQDAET